MTAPDWTVNIKNFGRVRDAEISLTPFLVMVGRNNTGKSYVASLLWGLMNPGRSIFQRDMFEKESFKKFEEFFATLIKREKVCVAGQDWNFVIDMIKEGFEGSFDEFSSAILAFPNSKSGSAQIKFNSLPDEVEIIIPQIIENKGPKTRQGFLPFRVKGNSIQFFGSINQVSRPSLVRRLAVALASYLMTGDLRGGAVYIPAARTGLMLAYKVLVAGLWNSLDFTDEEGVRPVLPRPIVDFLRDLTGSRRDNDTEFYQIATDIEKEILDGGIEYSDSEAEEVWYTPNGSDIKLPVHAVSSLVTELAPFILLLKSGYLPSTIIFEEPEAHLHLSAQRTLAKALVRLVNAKKRVVITTHSDTFLQQINMLMHLHEHSRKKKLIAEFNYREDELLDPKLSSGYLFDPGPDGTIVRPIVKTREGFVEPAMNEAIGNITNEIMKIQKLDDFNEVKRK